MLLVLFVVFVLHSIILFSVFSFFLLLLFILQNFTELFVSVQIVSHSIKCDNKTFTCQQCCNVSYKGPWALIYLIIENSFLQINVCVVLLCILTQFWSRILPWISRVLAREQFEFAQRITLGMSIILMARSDRWELWGKLCEVGKFSRPTPHRALMILLPFGN